MLQGLFISFRGDMNLFWFFDGEPACMLSVLVRRLDDVRVLYPQGVRCESIVYPLGVRCESIES